MQKNEQFLQTDKKQYYEKGHGHMEKKFLFLMCKQLKRN